MPLFPLQAVLLPGAELPLHIFEERYKEMVGNAIRDSSEFGIVLAQEDGIVNAGCTVIVEKLQQMYPDGRMDVLTRGRRRFEIQSLNEEKAYLQAEVSFFDDDDFSETPTELRDRAVSQYRALSQLGVLRDAEAMVRCRAAEALLMAKDKRGVPPLLALLTKGPLEVAWEAEGLLTLLAEDKSPVVSLGSEEAARKQCQEGWEAWGFRMLRAMPVVGSRSRGASG